MNDGVVPDVATGDAEARDVAAAEEWFAAHGLPWFVDGVDTRVAALLAPRRLTPVLGVCAAFSLVVGVSVTQASDAANGASAAVLVVLVLLLLYAGGPLRVATMARWAARSVVTELSLLLPLAVRALPLLLLFMTFLFINTEVWQVAGTLSVARVWALVLVFTAIGSAFLLTRLPEEVRRVERSVDADTLVRVCAGTPLHERAVTLVDEQFDDRPEGPAPSLTTTQRANLVLVLLAAQAFQVLLLAVAVFVFFIGFGALAVTGDVIRLWLGREPSYGVWERLGLSDIPISGELVKVSIFLSGFAALYFTIYAISDASYRKQFFAEIDSELEQAVAIRTVYRLLTTPTGGPA